METLERFSQFREALYQACSSRASALVELIDAVAQTPRPHSPAELSLAMQRHWTTLYDALRDGRFDLDELRVNHRPIVPTHCRHCYTANLRQSCTY